MTLTEAQIERVKSLEGEGGQLMPSQVVEDAKDRTSPLHGLFEWNKARAAELQWLDRAREIISSVRVVVTTQTAVLKTPMYVRDPEAKGQGYRSVTSLRNDPQQARESLIYTLEVAAGHIRRAYDLAEPLGLSGEIDALLESVTGVQRTVEQKSSAA